MWLAIVTANMLSELVFILQSQEAWPGPNAAGSGGGWEQEIQVPLWAAEMRQLLPSFLKPFEAGLHPSATVSESRLLVPTALAPLPGEHHQPLRVRAWDEGRCPTTPIPCMHVVVVNTLEGSPVEFTVLVDSPATAAPWPWWRSGTNGSGAAAQQVAPGAIINATRLFDYSYNVTLGFNGSKLVLHDWVGAGDVAVYEIGCTGPKPKERNDGSSPPWEPCANRRVTCWDHTSQCAGG